MMMTPACRNCCHWRERSTGIGNRTPWGECRIAAPQACRVDGNGAPLSAGDAHWGVWPATGPNDLCGQHSPLPTAVRT